MSVREQAEQMARAGQKLICEAAEDLDQHRFVQESWERPGGGGGLTRVLQDGTVFEKAGVNVSVVFGEISADKARSLGGGPVLEDAPPQVPFFATGVSTVLHPHNPMAPTAHANYRYFELGEADNPLCWWFGGGADLTPSYLFAEDASHFHQSLKRACDPLDEGCYATFKAACDTYFRLRHRDECRGVGYFF